MNQEMEALYERSGAQVRALLETLAYGVASEDDANAFAVALLEEGETDVSEVLRLRAEYLDACGVDWA